MMKRYYLVGITLITIVILVLVSGCSSGGTSVPTPTSSTPPAAKAAKLVFTKQPEGATAGSLLTTQPAVAVEDTNGNPVKNYTSPVALTITSGTGSSGASLYGGTKTSPVNGYVIYDGIYVTTAGSGYTLTASSGSLTSATSQSFNVTSDKAAKLGFLTQPSGTTAAEAFNTQPVVAVEDKWGNIVAGSNDPVTLAITTDTIKGNSKLSGTTTVQAINGLAKFTDVSINIVSSGYTLIATCNDLNPAISNHFSIDNAGPPAVIIFSSQPEGGTAGSPMFPLPVVNVRDANNNWAMNSNVSVKLTLTPGTGTPGAVLSGPTTISAPGGMVAIDGISINLPGKGYTLTATSNGLKTAISNPFDINEAGATPTASPTP